jgi:microcystin-dependent protein
MSFPKVVIKYEIPPTPVYPPTGGGSGSGSGGGTGGDGGGGSVEIPIVSISAAGLAPRIPAIPPGSGHPSHIFLRNDAAWQGVSYSDLLSVPSSFSPSPHAGTHVIGPDPLPLVGAHNPGFVPPLPASPSFVLKGAGIWASVAYNELIGTPSGFTPSAHALTHESGGSDAIPLDTLAAPSDTLRLNASIAAHGLLRKLDNNPVHFLDGTGTWSPGTIGPVGPTGPVGPLGPAGVNAFSVTTANFDLPDFGESIAVTLGDASWATIGQMVVIQTAGGDAEDAYSLKVTDKSGNTLTLTNVGSSTSLPLAGTTQNGLLKQVSGLTSDYVDGTNNCRDLKSSVAGVTAQVPTGVVIDYAGSGPPAGWLLCDGTSYPTATYPDLFAAISYTWGGSGASFNVPDLRSRVTVGAGDGTGPGLTNRILATTGGEETHPLTVAELAAHNHTASQADHYHTLVNNGSHSHTASQPDHYHTISGGGNHSHGASLGDHYHGIPAGGNHSHSDGGHAHSYVQPLHTSGPTLATGSGFTYGAENVGTGYASLSASGNIGPTQTYWTSQVGGIPGITVNNSGNITPNTTYESQTMGAIGVISVSAANVPNTNTESATMGAVGAVTVANTGSGTAHNNMPPFVVLNKIIKT